MYGAVNQSRTWPRLPFMNGPKNQNHGLKKKGMKIKEISHWIFEPQNMNSFTRKSFK